MKVWFPLHFGSAVVVEVIVVVVVVCFMVVVVVCFIVVVVVDKMVVVVVVVVLIAGGLLVVLFSTITGSLNMRDDPFKSSLTWRALIVISARVVLLYAGQALLIDPLALGTAVHYGQYLGCWGGVAGGVR